jgi:hypothetical protein
MVVQKVEVHFPIPVELSKDFERGLMQLVSTLCEGYEVGAS